MIKVKVTLEPVVYPLDSAKYQADWEEHCDEEGDVSDGGDYPPIPEEFVIAQFQEDLEDGEEDVSMIFESATVTVEKAP